MHDLLIVLLDTGCRHNEVARLQWSKIDLGAKTIDVWRKKTEMESVMPMTERLYAVLKRRAEAKRHDKWVFTNRFATGHRRDDTSYLNKLLNDAGVDYTVHEMRHTYASRLLKAGMTLVQIKEQLGHANIQSTIRYAHLEKNDTGAKAADVLNAIQAAMKAA